MSDYVLNLVWGLAAGALTGAALQSAIHSRRYRIRPFHEGDFRLRKFLWHPAVGTLNRLTIIFGMVAMATARNNNWATYVLLALWCLTFNILLSNVAQRGWKIGMAENYMPEFLSMFGDAIHAAVGDKTNAVFVQMHDLLELAERYNVPPSEIEHMVWRGERD